MARQLPKSLISWLMPKLRRASLYWPAKTIARDKAKVYDQIGEYKNGKPKYLAKYICAECERKKIKKLHLYEDTQMDHINPIIDIKGFTGDWTTLIESLFCSDENYQCLCDFHHKEKTAQENKKRFEYKKIQKTTVNLKKLRKLTNKKNVKTRR